MTDEVISTPSAPVESTPTTPEVTSDAQVSRPFKSPKPYDDDMMELYAKQEAGEADEIEAEPEVEVSHTEVKEEDKNKLDAKEKGTGLEDTPVKRQINGKEVEFKVKDAIQAYVKQEEFNRKMDQRVTHITQRERAWQADQESFKSKIGDVISVAQKGDFVSGIRALAKLATNGTGLDVVKFEKQYFEQLDKVRDVYSKMTPEQREAYFAKRALAEAESRVKSFEEEKATQSAHSQLQQQVQTLQQQHGLSEQEFWENYKTLADEVVGEGKVFKSAHDITPDDVVKYSLQVRHETKVLEAGKKAGIADEGILSKLSDITAADPNLTVDDIVEVIKNAGIANNIADKRSVENLNRKAGKSNIQFREGSSTKKPNGRIEGLGKEDLEFLYRKQPRVAVRPIR